MAIDLYSALPRVVASREGQPQAVFRAVAGLVSSGGRNRMFARTVEVYADAVFRSGLLRAGSGDVDKATGMHLPHRREPLLSENVFSGTSPACGMPFISFGPSCAIFHVRQRKGK